MKAPIKIYVDESRIDPLGNLLDAVVPDYRVEASDICYIRKEALLEWLESKIKDLSNGGFVNGLTTLAYKDVVEHINEM